MRSFFLNLFFQLILFGAVVAALASPQFKGWGKEKITAYFYDKGVIISDMKLDVLLPNGIEASDVKLVKPMVLAIDHLSLDMLTRRYTLEKLRLPNFFGDKDGVFDVKGNMDFEDGDFGINVELTGEPNQVSGKLRLMGKDPENFSLRIESASMNFMGGTLSVPSTVLPLGPGKKGDLPVKVEKLPLDAIVKMFAGEKALATSSITGTLKFEMADGMLQIASVNLSAAEPGKLSLPPGLIPVDSEQMALVATALSEFNFSALTIATVENGQGKKPDFTLRLEGSSPQVQGGQPIKLNVNLRGDVLETINSSVTLATKPSEVINEAPKQP